MERQRGHSDDTNRPAMTSLRTVAQDLASSVDRIDFGAKWLIY